MKKRKPSKAATTMQRIVCFGTIVRASDSLKGKTEILKISVVP